MSLKYCVYVSMVCAALTLFSAGAFAGPVMALPRVEHGGGSLRLAAYETLLQKMQREKKPVPVQPRGVVEREDITQEKIEQLYRAHSVEKDAVAVSEQGVQDGSGAALAQDAAVQVEPLAAPDVAKQADVQVVSMPPKMRLRRKKQKSTLILDPDIQSKVRSAVLAQEKPVYSGYILGAGDKLKIVVFGEDDLSGEYTVNDSGQISFPLIGEVDVRHSKVLEARDRIAALLADGYLKEPNIAIEVVEFRPFYIMGEVRSPGSYTYVADMSVMNAVALAGGFTYRADKDDVEIIREEQGKPVLYDDLPSGTKIVPGDIVMIQERFF